MWIPDLIRSLVLPVFALFALGPIDAWQRRTSQGLDGYTRAATAVALTLGWFEMGGELLGAIHQLRPLTVVLWAGLGVVLSLVAGRPKRPRFEVSVPVVLGFLLLFGYALMATFPPWDRDEMIYHLALPRVFAAAGGYVRPDDNIFASLPLGYESSLTLLHSLGGAPDYDPWFNPRLVGVFCAAGVALASVGLAKALGAKTGAPLAGLLVLLVPSFVEVGSSAYVEPALLLATTLTVTFAVRAISTEASSVVPAAAFGAMAINTKYPGLGWTLIVAGALFLDALGRDEPGQRRAIVRSLQLVVLALLLGSPFYVRNCIERKNPVFPLAYDLFGGIGWDTIRAQAYWETLRQYGAGDGLEVLTTPIRVFFTREWRHGFEGSIGPVVGLGVPGAIWLILSRVERATRRGIALVLVVVMAFSAFFSLSVVQARFFLAAVPLLTALVAVALDEIEHVRTAWLATAALIVSSVAWGADGYAHLWTRQPTWLWLKGQLTVDAARAWMLPKSYLAMRELETYVPATSKILLVGMRGYTYYLRRPYRVDMVFEEWRLAETLEATREPADLAQALSAQGISFVLATDPRILRDGSSDTLPGRTVELRRRWERAIAEGMIAEVARWGEVSLYQVASR